MKTRHRPNFPLVLMALVALGVLVFFGRTPELLAHGKAAIKVTPTTVVFGEKITVEGEQFEAEDEVTLTLVGLAGEIPLGSVKADKEGSFRFEVILPQKAHPGGYRVRASGEDATAWATLRIVASPEGVSAVEHVPGLGFHLGASPGETAVISAVLLLLAVAGFALAYRQTQQEGSVGR